MDAAEVLDIVIKLATPAAIAWVASVVKPIGQLKEKVAEFGVHLPVLSGAILKLEKSIDHQAVIIPQLVAEMAVMKEQMKQMREGR
jgi:hypothetical protein